MKTGDLILMAPAIAFAGGLAGVMQHKDHPGDVLFLSTSIALFAFGVAALGILAILVRDMRDNSEATSD